MRKLKKISILIITFFMCLIFYNFSYAVTQEEAGEAIATFAKNFYEDWGNKVEYTNSENSTEIKEAYQGLWNGDGKFKMNSWFFIEFIFHWCLGLGEDEYSPNFSSQFIEEVYDSDKVPNNDILKPGDLIDRYDAGVYGNIFIFLSSYFKILSLYPVSLNSSSVDSIILVYFLDFKLYK